MELNPEHSKALELFSTKGSETVAAGNRPHPTAPMVADSSPADVLEKNIESESFKAPAVQVSPQEALKAQIDIADQYVKQGFLDEAIDIYQQLLELDPQNPEVKQKLNLVYAAYAKTGTDLTSVFASISKVDEDKKKEELNPKNNEDAKRNLKELETKAREEADKQVKIALENRAREEAEKRAAEEMRRLAAEKEKKEYEKSILTRSEKLPVIGGLDDLVAVAEADLMNSQGRYDEAAKMYREILTEQPENEVVRKKLSAVEEVLRSKMIPPITPKSPPILKVVESPASSGTAADLEKDSNIKKKSNKIGYV